MHFVLLIVVTPPQNLKSHHMLFLPSAGTPAISSVLICWSRERTPLHSSRRLPAVRLAFVERMVYM